MTAAQPFRSMAEWSAWDDDNCGRCLRDALLRAGATETGCPILRAVFAGAGTPPQWVPPDAALPRQYTCLAMRPRGTAKDGGRQRRRTSAAPLAPRGVRPLFSLAAAGPRMDLP